MIPGYLSSAVFISWNGRPDFSRSVLRTGSLLSPDCVKRRLSILVEFEWRGCQRGGLGPTTAPGLIIPSRRPVRHGSAQAAAESLTVLSVWFCHREIAINSPASVAAHGLRPELAGDV